MKEILTILNENKNFLLNVLYWFLFVFGLFSIIGLKLVFSIIKNPKTLKPHIANSYIIFLVSVMNQEKVPTRFLTFTLAFGLLISRKVIFYFNTSYLNSFFLIIIFPILSFLMWFLLLYGYFYFSFLYPKFLGKKLIDFLETHANSQMLKNLGLKKKNHDSKTPQTVRSKS